MNKKLYRSNTDRMLAGVCGGIAEYFGLDSTWIRIAAVVFLLVYGTGILAYLLCWAIIPRAPFAE